MGDSVSVRCPACRAKLTLKSGNLRGRKISCPKCGKGFVAPAATGESDDELFGQLEANDNAAERPAGRVPPRRTTGGQKKPTRRSARPAWLVPGLIAGGVLLVVGLVAAIGVSSGWFGGPSSGAGTQPPTVAQNDSTPHSPTNVADSAPGADGQSPASASDRSSALPEVSQNAASLPPAATVAANVTPAATTAPDSPGKLTNSVGMELVLITPGKFLMGTVKDGQAEVTLTKAFYLGTTEVTQAQWKAVMGTTPWKNQDYPQYLREGDRYPATNMTWDEANAFCKKLSEKENAKYRLPTEAEWEYACRGGKTTRYSFGDDESQLGDYAWFMDNTLKVREAHAHEVGRKKPNPFGLFDMYGNVWEWCEDANEGAAPKKPIGGVDPLQTAGGDRVVRGGGWDLNRTNYDGCRFGRIQGMAVYNFGMRVCRSTE